jgi:NTE family protein
MYSKLSSLQLTKADIVIRPKVGYIGPGDFSRRHEAVLEGEKATLEVLPAINALVGKLQQEGRL